MANQFTNSFSDIDEQDALEFVELLRGDVPAYLQSKLGVVNNKGKVEARYTTHGGVPGLDVALVLRCFSSRAVPTFTMRLP